MVLARRGLDLDRSQARGQAGPWCPFKFPEHLAMCATSLSVNGGQGLAGLVVCVALVLLENRTALSLTGASA